MNDIVWKRPAAAIISAVMCCGLLTVSPGGQCACHSDAHRPSLNPGAGWWLDEVIRQRLRAEWRPQGPLAFQLFNFTDVLIFTSTKAVNGNGPLHLPITFGPLAHGLDVLHLASNL